MKMINKVIAAAMMMAVTTAMPAMAGNIQKKSRLASFAGRDFDSV